MNQPIYSLPVGQTITTAWDKVKGAKATIWGAIGFFFLIMLGFAILEGIGHVITPALGAIINVISQIVGVLLQMGLLYIGILRAKDSPIFSKLIFYTFDMRVAGKVILLYVLKLLVILIPLLVIFLAHTIAYTLFGESNAAKLLTSLLYLIGFISIIYLYLRMYVSMGLVLEKGTQPWDAVKMSFQATRGNVWNILGILILQFLIVLISMIPLGIGLIWTLPFAAILYGVVYKSLLINIDKLSA